LMLLISAEARQILLQIPRFLRRAPWLLWLILLEGVLLWLYQWELQRFDVLQRSYSAWVLAWTLMLLLFAGITRTEMILMKRRLEKSRLTGIMISLTTLFLIVIGTELALRHVITFSNSYAIGLNHRRWMEQYELPQVNTLGYRDYPHDRNIPAETQRIVVAGDSFAAGFGISDIANTFPHLLDTRLDDTATVHVMAKPGWETDAILRELPEYPIKSDILIYSYFLNDILYLEPTQTDQWRELFAEPPALLTPLIDNFYLPEVLYWNIYRQWLTGGDTGYGNIIQEIYEDDVLWETHNDDFIRLIEWSSEQDANLVVLIWPLLIQPEETAIYTRRVEEFFRGRGIPVVNMSDYIAGKTPGEMIVNPFDMHPNEVMHQLAADKLYETLSSTGLIQIDESP
ncbi:MAG: SGNH/GDSL hydrolase family protein, partial [Aggregatilineales bacterium]